MDASVLPPRRKHGWLAARLLGVALAFFAFGYALVPLYDTLCEAVGFNGRTAKGAIAPGELPLANRQVDPSRTLAVHFTSTRMPGLPWEIRPLEAAIALHPGELRTTRFLVRNLSDRTIVGQAVPSVMPGAAARHLLKLDCFCFRQQSLAPGESREMALTFLIDTQIGADIGDLTLAYAFFPAPDPR